MEYLQQERPHFRFHIWYLYCRELWMKLKANVPIWTTIIYNDILRNWNTLFLLPICGTMERICYLAYRIHVNKLSWVPVPYPPHPPVRLPHPLPRPLTAIYPRPAHSFNNWALRSWKRHKCCWYIVFIKCWGKSILKKYRFFDYHRKFSRHSQIVRAQLISLPRRHNCPLFYISV